MKIESHNAGKKFNRSWVFRNFNYSFTTGNAYAIIGPNGSGKSTLLQTLAGAYTTSEGSLSYFTEGDIPLQPDLLFRQISMAAPYLDIIEEMTAEEFLSFHSKFKPLIQGFTFTQILSIAGLSQALHKQIRLFSSGMKQRLKLAQAFFSDTAILLLDEPCTNLDREGVALYQRLISDFAGSRLVIVSSNDEEEYSFCESRIDIRDYK